MTTTKNIPSRTQKLIIQEAAGVCAFCKEDAVATLEFHHIKGRDISDPHNADNLIYTCKNCHGKIHAGEKSEKEVIFLKINLRNQQAALPKTDNSMNTVNISGGVNEGIITNEYHAHSSKSKRPTIKPPEGTVAADGDKKRYLIHIIKKYHKFARIEKKGNYKFQIFYASIERRYGAKWEMIPIHLFEDVCEYIQGRIDKTKTGRIRKARNQKNFSSYIEYLEKYTKKK